MSICTFTAVCVFSDWPVRGKSQHSSRSRCSRYRQSGRGHGPSAAYQLSLGCDSWHCGWVLWSSWNLKVNIYHVLLTEVWLDIIRLRWRWTKLKCMHLIPFKTTGVRIPVWSHLGRDCLALELVGVASVIYVQTADPWFLAPAMLCESAPKT